MSRRGWLLVGLLGLGFGVGLLLAGRRLEGAGSTLSRGGNGWLATRLYLARRGAPPVLVDRPLAEVADGDGTLVIAFPWQGRVFDIDHQAVLAHLAAGGDVVIAYASDSIPSPAERVLLEGLGVDSDMLPRSAPLSPWRWHAAASTPWRLRPAPRWTAALRAGRDENGAAGLRLRAPRWLPELPHAGALLLHDDRVVAAAWPMRRGRLVVLPAELLANARLREPAHAALLETLRGWLRAPWRFDELHHGFGVEDTQAAATGRGGGLDRLLLQLGLIYLVAALALGRRLGPAWRESAPIAGSAGGFLLRLAALHHRLGHHGAGAALLLRRAAELDRRLSLDPELSGLADRGDAAALVEVGQAVARLQRR